MKRPFDSLLWIYAIPGAGKTVMASHIIGQLTLAQDRPSEVLYFFFKHFDTDKGSPIAAVRASAHQLLQSPSISGKHELFENLVDLMDRGGQTRASGFWGLWEVLRKHMLKLPDVVIVLDALDECSAAVQPVPRLLSLAQQGTARILLTGHREADLDAALRDVQILHMGVDEVSEDIRLFVEHRVWCSSKL
jgi:hypothetical protein